MLNIKLHLKKLWAGERSFLLQKRTSLASCKISHFHFITPRFRTFISMLSSFELVEVDSSV